LSRAHRHPRCAGSGRTLALARARLERAAGRFRLAVGVAAGERWLLRSGRAARCATPHQRPQRPGAPDPAAHSRRKLRALDGARRSVTEGPDFRALHFAPWVTRSAWPRAFRGRMPPCADQPVLEWHGSAQRLEAGTEPMPGEAVLQSLASGVSLRANIHPAREAGQSIDAASE